MRRQFTSACFLLAAMLILMAAAGCGRHTSQGTASTPSVKATGVPLPEWAPENPSPEFMRAARVIKSWPTEYPVAGEPDLAAKAFNARFQRCLVPAWEFFGTLSDEQIERFRTTRDLRIQMKDLTDKQRAALYRFFDTWREEMKGLPERPREWTSDDWLVELYKGGAKEDLSNVQVQFLVRGSGRVAMFLRARLPDGSLGPVCPIGLGDM